MKKMEIYRQMKIFDKPDVTLNSWDLTIQLPNHLDESIEILEKGVNYK